ncbi:hypothetical protein LA080_007910 [Diaporthe eres]|nr:hypothetical protein LA080_007910 [Diaporthe eres]
MLLPLESLPNGNEKDWEEQSGKVREVYSNSLLARAAEDTADCALGLQSNQVGNVRPQGYVGAGTLDTSVDESEDEQDITHQNLPDFLASGSHKALFYAWYSIAENYSSRILTKPPDKLAALSGLASLLASSIPEGSDNYLAGIWRHDLAEGLLWHAEEPCARYLTYIAPSWSWASMAGKISYFHERNQFPFESCVDIKDSVCEKSFLDPTGSVSGGHIRLIGEVVAVHLLVLSSSSAMILAGDPKTANQKSYVSKYHGGGGAFGSAYKDQLIFAYPLGTSMERHWEALCDERMPLTTACKLKDHCEQDFECIVESESERG